MTEGYNFGAALFLWNRSSMPCEADALFIRPFADAFQHADPFREDDDFDIGIGEAIVEHAGDLVELLAIAGGVALNDSRSVADHAHYVQKDHQKILFFWRER